MTNDHLIFRHRVRLFARAQEVGVSRACRELGYHRSSYYRWKPFVLRHGLEILPRRERRAPRMPNQVPPWLEERVVAFALGHPVGPRRIAAQLALAEWGGERISHGGVYQVLSRHDISTRRRRLALVAGYQSPPEPEGALPLEPAHLEAALPGSLVQPDCFHIGRLSGTVGRVRQYTAIDVRSGFLWAEVHVKPLNPAAGHASALVRRVARELASAGWKLDAVTTDNGSEFRAGEFRGAVESVGAEQRFMRAGRPQTNGAVEQVQKTVLEGVLAPELRALARTEVHRTPPRPRALPQLLQLAPRAHGAAHQRSRLRRGRLWCAKDASEMSRRCRDIS